MSTERTRIIDIHQLKTSCAECSLSELCLPRDLNNEELERLEKLIGRTRPLNRGEHVFHAGERFDAIYAVRSGAIKVYQNTDAGEEQILGFNLPGELLGLDAIHGGSHRCSALAMETSSICSFHYSQLEQAFEHMGSLHQQMCRLMSREISSENSLLLMLKNKTAEERVSAFLVNLSMRYQRLGYSAYEFRLPMSREEIGNYLGLTTETVSRILSKLQRDEVIATQRRFIQIKDRSRLHRLCNDDMSGEKDHSLS